MDGTSLRSLLQRIPSEPPGRRRNFVSAVNRGQRVPYGVDAPTAVHYARRLRLYWLALAVIWCLAGGLAAMAALWRADEIHWGAFSGTMLILAAGVTVALLQAERAHNAIRANLKGSQPVSEPTPRHPRAS